MIFDIFHYWIVHFPWARAKASFICFSARALASENQWFIHFKVCFLKWFQGQFPSYLTCSLILWVIISTTTTKLIIFIRSINIFIRWFRCRCKIVLGNNHFTFEQFGSIQQPLPLSLPIQVLLLLFDFDKTLFFPSLSPLLHFVSTFPVINEDIFLSSSFQCWPVLLPLPCLLVFPFSSHQSWEFLVLTEIFN